MTLLLNGKGPAVEPADWHVRSKMTQPQQALETRLAEETPEGFDCDSSAPGRKSPGGECWGNDHPVNVRLSIPFLFARFYVTVVAGKERRSRERRTSEYRKHSLMKVGNVLFIVAVQIVCCIALLYAGLSALTAIL